MEIKESPIFWKLGIFKMSVYLDMYKTYVSKIIIFNKFKIVFSFVYINQKGFVKYTVVV